MCYAVYLSSPSPLREGVIETSDIGLEQITDEERAGLQSKFSWSHIYHVGSPAGDCSCALQDEDTAPSFILLLKKLTLTNDIEYYCCWEGDWKESTEYFETVDIHDPVYDPNQFPLTEREFIKFMHYS